MDLAINNEPPRIMHIDLNSCYAIIEQQANPLIRGKPVGVAAYDSPGGFIIASSYEAKRLGIKLMRIRDARKISKDIIILTPDPEKYFDAHRRFKAVLERYTSEVIPKSVDEFVVDFKGSAAIREGKSLVNIGRQIKRDIQESLGEYVTVNIGIAPNRFLAKVAAGLDKPDGLDVLRGEDIMNIYGQLSLMDLPGINHRYNGRLALAGIASPLDFLEAPMHKLKHEVFKSIVGYYWYLRLRGYEVDSAKFKTKSFGNEYAVGDKTSDPEKVSRMIMKLCEKTGRRLRKHDYQAQGIALWLSFENGSFWGKSKRTKSLLYSTQDIYLHALRLIAQEFSTYRPPQAAPDSTGLHFSSFDEAYASPLSDKIQPASARSTLDSNAKHETPVKMVNFPARVTHIHVAVFDVVPATPVQLGLFDSTRLDTRALAIASDKINDTYGEYTVVPAKMAHMQDVIIKRVPFGSVRDI